MSQAAWHVNMAERLIELVADRLSASEIAFRLCNEFEVLLTRNAIIGKCHRLGITLASKSAKNTSRRMTPGMSNPFVFRKARDRQPPTPERICEPVPGGLTLMQLEPHSCRFPVGDPKKAEFRFCGARKNSRSSYCTTHFELCLPSIPRHAEKEAA